MESTNFKNQNSSVRVDVAIPLAIFNQIEYFAELTKQPFTPKSKNTDNPKRAVTGVIIFLLEQSLKKVETSELFSYFNTYSIDDISIRISEIKSVNMQIEEIIYRMKELKQMNHEDILVLENLQNKIGVKNEKI